MDSRSLLSAFSPSRTFRVLLVVCCAVFAMRGPYRALRFSGPSDLLPPYIQSTAWLHGIDPYAPQSLPEFWPKEEQDAEPTAEQVQDGSILMYRGIPTAYPLTSFVLLAPLTLLPWKMAEILWVGLSVALFFVTLQFLAWRSRCNPKQKAVFLLSALLLAPFHTGIATCNIAIVATEVGVIGAVLAEQQRRQTSGAILIAVSAALKPQIGLVFVAYYILRRAWRVSTRAIGILVAIAAAGVFRLAGVHWIASYAMDNRALLSTGILGDFTERNPTRFGLVNLQVALYPWLHDRHLTDLWVFAVCFALFCVTVFLITKMHSADHLLGLSALACLSLLPVYHRFYDAALLIVPLSWFVSTLKFRLGRRGRFGLSSDSLSAFGLFLISVFFLPGGSLLETLRQGGRLPEALSGSVWWNGLVMAHAVWCSVGLLFVLLYEMGSRMRPAVVLMTSGAATTAELSTDQAAAAASEGACRAS